MTGTLYLIPNVVSEGQLQTIPPSVVSVLPSIRYFLAEDIRTARRYLSSLKIFQSIGELHFEVLNKDTAAGDLAELMKPLSEGKDVGILSESGCPGIADPGALAVSFAHERGIKVAPLVGPSSIFLALMSSGLNGQRFAFHGYLPIDSKESVKTIKELERESLLKNQTQIVIETPYRNNQVLDHLLTSLKATTLLTIALDITGKNEFIHTKPILRWKKDKPTLEKLPAVFCFLAPNS